ncbi:MAG: hypothetical protein K1X67_15310 [Fimbriimonadaceae bacterium]|nr:hypothetical protein [Fimbriimonadaceae bacterium]
MPPRRPSLEVLHKIDAANAEGIGEGLQGFQCHALQAFFEPIQMRAVEAGMHGGVKNDREMATRLRASKELQYIDAPIRNDVAFRQAAEHGLAVNELKGSHRDAGAISDMARLLEMIQSPQLCAAHIARLQKDRIAKAG